MATVLAIFAVFFIFAAMMGIGLFFGRKPIKGSCGGITAVGVEKACGCTDSCANK